MSSNKKGSPGHFKNGTYHLCKSELENVSIISNGVVFTRFPPEPNGPLHIGHVKALEINKNTAKLHNGKWILRFDDTNPDTGRATYRDEAVEVLTWMGYHPDKVTYSSDYFFQLFACALKLICKGLAYVCHEGSRKHISLKDKSQMTHSVDRNNSININLEEFSKMVRGKYNEGEVVLRLKMETKSGFRDPVAYRINYSNHYRTNKIWNIYPTYDYAHPLCDSFEKIAISLCSKEFQSHRPIYEWVLENSDKKTIKQREFNRLNIKGNILSKRNILLFMEKMHSSTCDPRLLTLTGLRRRGISPEVIRHFVCRGKVDINELYKDVISFCSNAPKLMAILDPLKCHIINYDEFRYQYRNKFTINQQNITTCGNNLMLIDRIVYINNFDFQNTTCSSKHYLTLNSKVALSQACTVIKVQKAYIAEAKVVRLDLIATPITSDSYKGCKVITWLSDPAEADLNSFGDVIGHNPSTLTNKEAEKLSQLCFRFRILVPNSCWRTIKYGGSFVFGQVFQAERFGFMVLDRGTTLGKLVFNMTCWFKLHQEMRENILKCGREIITL